MRDNGHADRTNAKHETASGALYGAQKQELVRLRSDGAGRKEAAMAQLRPRQQRKELANRHRLTVDGSIAHNHKQTCPWQARKEI